MNTDNILSIALTFALLAGGTAAIGSELLGSQRAPQASARLQASVVTLPTVSVIGHREPAVLLASAR